ncbi:MAG TPA: serine/threonine-protein kinase, partial [Ktedonobacteraceae bacterium]|nr:serine/threonine-protein kinase [Ktedonobacteraceae bacterium]
TVPLGTILHGRYRIERVLGSGGFGHVYLAIDLKTNLQYAIKEYFVTGTGGQAQLQHEARVLSQLHHPNLPAFHNAFDERGHYFVVLSYIEGSDLTDRIRVARQRNEIIPLPQIMAWILSVSDAVNFLHTQQPVVIHRDIKPDNIRIMPNGTAILVDLGNAKATADGARTLLFIRHQGTPGYAPQEQYPGGTGTDVRSDVYALGATLYFALTAHEPPSVSTRNQSIQQGLPDLPSLQEVLARNPPEDSGEANAGRQFRLGVSKPAKPAPRHIRHVAQLGTLPPTLLNQLNSIITRAMAMRQRDRYQTIAEFSNDLRHVAAALPPLPSTPTPRPVDPNSTQPDLPFLYETIQRAKENAVQPSPGETSNPSIQPAAHPAQPLVCPRCSAPLLQRSSFCPSCGSSLSNVFNASAPTTVTELDQKNNKTSHRDKPPARDTSLDATMIIRQPPQSQAMVLTYQTNQQEPSVNLATNSTHAGKAPMHKVQVQNSLPTKNTVFSPAAQLSSQSGKPHAKAPGFNLPLRLFIVAVIIVLLVLLAVIILILVSHGHSSHALINNGIWLPFRL